MKKRRMSLSAGQFHFPLRSIINIPDKIPVIYRDLKLNVRKQTENKRGIGCAAAFDVLYYHLSMEIPMTFHRVFLALQPNNTGGDLDGI